MAQHVVVREYSPVWREKYEEEAEKIREILGDNCLEIHHIGSTAVEGLKAKPIIDILPVVRDLGAVDARAGDFEELGYEYLGSSASRGGATCGREGTSAPTRFTYFPLRARGRSAAIWL